MTALDGIVYDIFGARIADIAPVSGGDINRAYRLTLSDGARVFMKANAQASPAFFRAEAQGLEALRSTGAIPVPGVIAMGRDERHGAFLLLEWIDTSARGLGRWEDFGRALAKMHLADTAVPGGRFGFHADNYIGARPQKNAPRDSWIDFFRDNRLVPQFRDALHWFDEDDRRRMTRLLDHLEDHLAEPDRPSLLHGDLWSGNFVAANDGSAWLIDPAAYVGHHEADLAMTQLFGGFHPRFYDGYREVLPPSPGYGERRDLYNLYHLLNHLNLFGGGYLGSVQRILKKYAGR